MQIHPRLQDARTTHWRLLQTNSPLVATLSRQLKRLAPFAPLSGAQLLQLSAAQQSTPQDTAAALWRAYTGGDAPPPRPADYDLTKVPREKIAAALRGFESLPQPIGQPGRYAAAPILTDALKQLRLLGTDTLSVRELAAFVQLNNDWCDNFLSHFKQPGGGAVDLYATRYLPVLDRDLNALDLLDHDLHFVLAGGFQRTPDYRSLDTPRSIQPGLGGEQGLYARITVSEYAFNNALVEQDSIKSFLEKRLSSASFDTQAADRRWALERGALVDAPMAGDGRAEHTASINHMLSKYVKLGFLARPEVLQAATPFIDRLIASGAGTEERGEAADGLIGLFRQYENLLKAPPSIAAITAEVQLVELVGSFVRENDISLSDSNLNVPNKINFFDLYDFYLKKVDNGTLTSPEAVLQWFREWNQPFSD